MHPIAVLMLAESVEEERRLAIEKRRRQRLIQSEPMRPNDRRRLEWLARLPRWATGSLA